VSDEKQEKEGESLPVQRSSIERDVNTLEGFIVDWYGGQEHATPGHDRLELERLIKDALKGRINAVIMMYEDRWDRGDRRAEEALDIFQQHGIKFYIGTSERNLLDPTVRGMLRIQSAIGRMVTELAQKKSIESRIARAKKGEPSSGGKHCLPYGRTWSRKDGWGLDEGKVEFIKDVARRYLAGEASVVSMAQEAGLTMSYLYQVLRERSGPVWVQHFRDPRFRINEEVPTAVPPLLDKDTIRRIKERLEDNTTRHHGRPKYNYLLNGYIFCAGCGYNLTGQVKRTTKKRTGTRTTLHYYRHPSTERRQPCPYCPRPMVRARDVEERVIEGLFDLCGNPAAIAEAIREAAPDLGRERKRQAKLEADLAKLREGRDRIMRLVLSGRATEEEADKVLDEAREREQGLQRELDSLVEVLSNTPDEEAVQLYVQQMGDCIVVYDQHGMGEDANGEQYPGGNNLGSFLSMTWEDKRRLVQAAFSQPQRGGKPSGVYITPVEGADGKRVYDVAIRGMLPFEEVLAAVPRPGANDKQGVMHSSPGTRPTSTRRRAGRG
jgi:hypothetical protein